MTMMNSSESPSGGPPISPAVEEFVDPYDYYEAMRSGSRAERLFHAARLDLVLDTLPVRAGRLLDVGGGAGCLALPLATRGFDVTVVEPGVQLLDTLQEHAESLGVQVASVHGDGRDLPFESGSFDVVMVASVLHLVPFAEALLTEAERVCAPTGHLVVAGPWQRHPKSMTRVKTVLKEGPLAALRGRSSGSARATFPFNERLLKRMLRRSTHKGANYNYLMGYFATLWSPNRSD